MERLKAILADKILDLSSGHSDDVKSKIDKMQRFRDFANACQTLMIKYPQIEDELIKMVNDGDFDTKVASSRVDSVIRLADKEVAKPQIAEEPTEQLIAEIEEEEIPSIAPIEETVFQPEDIDYEEVAVSEEDQSKNGYVPYEEVNGEASPFIEEEIILSAEELEELEAKKKQKETIRRIVQIVGIILAVVILIIVVKLVIKHWVVILSVVGGIAFIALIIWFLKKKKS